MISTGSKILIVEDEPLLKSLLSSLLESAGYKTAVAGSAAEARQVAEDFQPNAAVLDIELGDGPSGIDLAGILRSLFPAIGIVFLTHIPEPKLVGVENRSVPKNAAYLRKDQISDPLKLSKAIEVVLSKGNPKSFRDDKTVSNKLTDLSRSQLDVLRMIALGLSNHEIAAQRGTTVRAVEHLVKRAFDSAGVSENQSGNLRVAAARQFIEIAGLPHSVKR